MASDVPIASGVLLAGKYKLLDLLGQGGMGAVYLAENVDIGRQVAIKLLKPELAADPTSLARFRQEARAAASIGHPGIVEILDMGLLPEGGAFIVMERLEGQTLREKLARDGSLYPFDAVAIVGAVLDTLAAAHDKGVIHRDLKPDNIFLVERPLATTKILDFGISKFRGTGDVALTRTGMVMGTPLYMSPEQARGARDVGVTADLYSIGAILYEALSGQPPFPGESYNEVLAKVLMDTARPLGQLRPDVPPEMAYLIEGMLAKDPSARPQNARDAAQRLRASVPADWAPMAKSPRGTSSTFVRPTPSPIAPSHQTGPRPPADAWKPPTQPPPAMPLPATHVRPPPPNAHLPTQDQVLVAQPVNRSGNKVALFIGLAFVVLIAVGVGIRLGQRSVVKGLVQAKAAKHPATVTDAKVKLGDDKLEVVLPSGKITVDDKGVQLQAKTDAAPDAGPAAAKPTAPAAPAEPPTAEAPSAPTEPSHPARRAQKSGVRQAGFKPGHKKAEKSGAVLPGFTPSGTYR